LKIFTAACVLCLILFAVCAHAGELKVIELKDGSVISGEVISLSGGTYTIKSDSLGMIKLEESKISAIRSKTAPSGPAAATVNAGTEAKSLQEKMLSDKEIMSMIQSLQDDPDFKKLLEDPETLKAVQAGDVAALMANPQFMKLLNNPTVRDIRKKVQ
jgi:hypothetical protein